MSTLTQDFVIERVASSEVLSAGGWIAFVDCVEDLGQPCLIEAFVALDNEDGEPGYRVKRWSNVPSVGEARSIAAEALSEMDDRIEQSIKSAVEVSLLNA